MRKSSAKYTKAQTAEWEGEILFVLASAQEAMNIDQIKASSVVLANVTNQKMARCLSTLIDMNFVRKAKTREGRMVYKSLAVMKEQGYDVD